MSILQWGTENVVNTLKDEKISVGIVTGILALAVWAKAWADKEYVTQRDFDKKSEEITHDISGVSGQVAELKRITDEHVEEFRLSSATQAIRNAKSDYTLAALAGANEAQLEALAEEVDEAVRYKECLRRRESNCRTILE